MSSKKPWRDTWRLEIFPTSQEELQATVDFVRANDIQRINIPNKQKNEDSQLLNRLRVIRNALPDLDICLHYSINLNYSRTAQASFQHLLNFCKAVHQVDTEALALNSGAGGGEGAEGGAGILCQADSGNTAAGLEPHAACDRPPTCVLIVSGGGKKKQFDSVRALQMIEDLIKQQPCANPTSGSDLAHQHEQQPECKRKQQMQQMLLPPLAVAFNPYLPEEAPHGRKAEQDRLTAKLQTGLVSAVYLQMGTDCDMLAQGVGFLQEQLQLLRASSSRDLDRAAAVGMVGDEMVGGSGDGGLTCGCSASAAGPRATSGPMASVKEASSEHMTGRHHGTGRKRKAEQAAISAAAAVATVVEDPGQDSRRQQQQQEGSRGSGAMQPCGASPQHHRPLSTCSTPPPAPQLQLLGSVLLPSKRLLAQMRFRPWSGVHLSEEYLRSVEGAVAETRRLLECYAAHGVAPLLEVEVGSAGELQTVLGMLLEGAESGGGLSG